MEEQIASCTEQALRENVFPGCVIGIVHMSGERLILPHGKFTYDADAREVQQDTVYDTASLTKSIPTGSLALMLIGREELNVNDRLIKYVPEFNNADRTAVLVKHLLTYTLDGYGLASALRDSNFTLLKDTSAADLRHVLLTHDFERRPGTIFKYTNVPAALLGMVVEKILGKPLDVLADEHFFIPLKMARSTFHPKMLPLVEIAPTEIDDWRGEVRGVVHDESAYIAAREGVVVGHAGLFSTAGDILNFLEMLLKGGKNNDILYFPEEIVEQMETNQIPELHEVTGLGWELQQPRYMGSGCGPHTFGKTGFTGTVCVVDRSKEIAYVILSNRTYPKRPKDSLAINAFRAAIGEIILGV